MAVVSRLQLNHPALGTLGGGALHTSVESLYQRIGDNMNSRFLTSDALASGNNVDLTHNINVDFADLGFLLYERNTSTNELIQRLTTGFAISATVGNEKTQVNVANTSGVTRDIALVVVHGGGGGGGGGGALNWYTPAGEAPVEDYYFDSRVFVFRNAEAEKLTAMIKVPASYTPGTQITMRNYAYSVDNANNWLMQTVATLLRTNTDAASSVTNTHTDDSGDILNTSPNIMRSFTTGLTDSAGEINGVAVAANDIIKVVFTREAPTGTASTLDVRFIPELTEVSV
jgi:hypothetical protein